MIILCGPLRRIRYELQIGARNDDAACTGSFPRQELKTTVCARTDRRLSFPAIGLRRLSLRTRYGLSINIASCQLFLS